MASPEYGLYGYRPNLPSNIVGCVLFGIILIFQIAFGLWARDWWMFVTWGIGAGLELTGYIARALSYHYYRSAPLYELQLITLIIGPAFTAAGLYYQLAKLVTIYGKKYSFFKPMIYNAIFTTCDVISLVIQGAGGGEAATNIETKKGPAQGGWIMVGGIAFQVLILVIFIVMFSIVCWKIFRDDPENWDQKHAKNRKHPLFKYWLPTVCISLLFLLIRSVYRIAELSEGWTGKLMRTERYFLILDGLMIALSMVPLCLVHPGIATGNIPIEGLHYSPENDKEAAAGGATPNYLEFISLHYDDTEKTSPDSEKNGSDFFTPPPQ